ncbi:hypothetical protein F4604DRAFT_1737901 [Suillus subluteus]|nr:hypothetical protein F4604DRAFT_1737901 [Suillus subluteus]
MFINVFGSSFYNAIHDLATAINSPWDTKPCSSHFIHPVGPCSHPLNRQPVLQIFLGRYRKSLSIYINTHDKPRTQDTLSHDWGSASQLLNWVLLLTHFVAALFDVNVFGLPTAAALIIFFPMMESVYWIIVGNGKDKTHLRIYGEIHDWIAVKWANLWMVIILGAIDWVINIIMAVMILFPRTLPNQHPEAGMDPPPYPSDFRTDSCDETVTLQGVPAKV